jgi:phenylpropionate dioxygenase-like ring-hydroxylating dioxygenase large terminal subunit
MTFEEFWYVVAVSHQLKPKTVFSRMVLGEWLALFRNDQGKPVALRDRCLHRNSRLSCGHVHNGHLYCPYHGWEYDGTGKVVAVPAEGPELKSPVTRTAISYETCEQDGYIYVRLKTRLQDSTSQIAQSGLLPFPLPHNNEPGWETVRVINRFHNSVANCAENFINIPHTAFVHSGVFRQSRHQQLEMTVERCNGSVIATYHNETNNLGWFSRFLNPERCDIRHIDRFYMPNVTSVEYDMGPHRRLFITSQLVPETETMVLVYTDVTYNYGIWTRLVRPWVHWTTQHIIRQDLKILNIQQDVIEKYGQQFSNTPADTIHVFVESILNCLASGGDPRALPDRSVTVKFWV